MYSLFQWIMNNQWKILLSIEFNTYFSISSLLVVGCPIRLNYWRDAVIDLSISLFLSLYLHVKFLSKICRQVLIIDEHSITKLQSKIKRKLDQQLINNHCSKLRQFQVRNKDQNTIFIKVWFQFFNYLFTVSYDISTLLFILIFCPH